MTPTFAPTIYHDGESLFLELPGSPGQALRFPFTEGGLSKALRHIPNITRQPGYVTGRTNLTAKVGVNPYGASSRLAANVSKATQAKRDKARLSEGMRNAASALLRKRGLGS